MTAEPRQGLGQGLGHGLRPPFAGWVTLVVLAGPMLLILFFMLDAVAVLASSLPPAVLLGSGLLYLLAHGFRAIRLAAIAAPLLGVSGRSGGLLHLVTAPGATILPFKLGEVVRMQQLWQLGRSLSGAITVVLVERSLDAVMLLALLVYLHAARATPSPSGTVLLALTLCAVMLAALAFVLAPRALAALQCYVVQNHFNRRSLRHLGQIDALRRVTTKAAAILGDQGPLLMVLSILIWALEIAAVQLMVGTLAGSSPALGAALLAERILAGPIALMSSPEPSLLFASAALGMLVLTLAGLPALWFYLGRMAREPVRRRRGLLKREVGTFGL